MSEVPKTFWILDLGSWAVRLLKVQALNGELINWESFDHVHQISINDTLNFQQNYLKQLPSALNRLIERSNVNGPIHVLLPSSIFTYDFGSQYESNLLLQLDENIRQKINLMLSKKGLEAAFLGSGICAEIEYLCNKEFDRSQKNFLFSITYSSSYFVEIINGSLSRFWQDTSINGIQLDSMMRDKINCLDSTKSVLDWKKNEFALLPVYRPIQERLSEFEVLKDFLSIVDLQLNQWETADIDSTIYLSGGVTQLRNLDAYLEGTRTNQYESFCTSFFKEWLENTTLGSDNQNGWASCFAHAGLILQREKANVESSKRRSS